MIRAADTRMAGYFIAFGRFLRLKNVLKQTINSNEFIESRKKNGKTKRKLEWAAEMIENEAMWKNLNVLTKSIFPALCVLRLADRSEAGMHMLYYFWRMAKMSFENHKAELNKINSFIDFGDAGDDLSDGDVDSDSDNENEDEGNINANVSSTDSLGDQIFHYWNSRKKKIVSDFAILGWLLCPVEEVHKDMTDNFHEDHMNQAEKVLRILLHTDTDEEFTNHYNTFREEHREFMRKIGLYEAKSKMWQSSLLDNGKVHEWHDIFSINSTEVLGWVACRVTSKILGIGNAERAWGAVKQLKSGRRGHLSGANTKKQATIFAKACIDNAILKRQHSSKDGETRYNTWANDYEEFERMFGNDKAKTETENTNKPLFKCWTEEWETSLQYKKDTINKTKFEKKYIGIKFYDHDFAGRILECVRVNYTKLHGYAIACKIYDQDEEDDEDNISIQVIIECILERDCQHLNTHVRMVTNTTDDLRNVPSPGRASARKVSAIDIPSDDSDSDSSQTPVWSTKLYKGKRKIPKEFSQRKKNGGIIKPQVKLIQIRMTSPIQV